MTQPVPDYVNQFGNEGSFTNVQQTNTNDGVTNAGGGSFVGTGQGTNPSTAGMNLNFSGPDAIFNGVNNVAGYLGDDQANPSMNPLFYEQAANTASSQAANLYAQGQAAGNVAAPTINDATGAQSRAQLAGSQAAYNALNKNLASTIAGGGINAGAMTQIQGQNQNIAQQLTAANSGRGAQGGFNLGNAGAAMAQGAGAQGQLSSQAAAARGAQINAAQGGLGSNLAGQGGQLMATSATNYNAALSQAQLDAQQRAADQAQQMALYTQSGNEQGQYLNAANAYIGQAQAAQGLNVKQQAINNQQTNQTVGAVTGGATTGLELAAMA